MRRHSGTLLDDSRWDFRFIGQSPWRAELISCTYVIIREILCTCTQLNFHGTCACEHCFNISQWFVYQDYMMWFFKEEREHLKLVSGSSVFTVLKLERDDAEKMIKVNFYLSSFFLDFWKIKEFSSLAKGLVSLPVAWWKTVVLTCHQ